MSRRTNRVERDQQPSFGGVRRCKRRDLETDVVLQDASGWEIPVESVDISPTGMFVQSEFLFHAGANHTLIFRAPDGQFLFRISARVVRVEDEEGETPGMAYEFIGVSPEIEAQLRTLVTTADRGGASNPIENAGR